MPERIDTDGETDRDAGDADAKSDDDLLEVPVVSGGESTTVRTTTVTGIGGPIATVARTPRVTVRDALETARGDGFDGLQTISVRERLAIVGDAGRRFEGIGPATALGSPAAYERPVARATGLPVGWVHTSAHWLGYGLRHAAEALRAQSPTGGLDVYDEPSYTRERSVGLAFAPRVRVLGAVMPGNDPAVYAWPALALAMGIPIVLRPSDRDPFTPLRLARAFLAAGVPETAIHVLPAERAVGETIAQEADHAMVFGDERAVASYRNDRTVETYGPGNSVAVLARDPTERELETLARGITRAGGRTCFNLTRIIATGPCDPDRLAAELARRVAGVREGSIDDRRTDVPAFPDGKRAKRIDARVEALDGADVTATYRTGPRRIDGTGTDTESDAGTAGDVENTRLRPTVLRTPTLVEELPFPFAGVTERDREAISEIGPAYLGVCIGDEDLERAMVRSPQVRKVYGGAYPAAVDLRETHEEYLTSFCYETTTYDPSPG